MFFDITAPEFRGEIADRIRRPRDGKFEIMGLRKDGTKFWMEIQAKSTTYQGRQVRVATVHDISDKKRLEQQAEHILAQERQARIEAERSARLRDEFINIVAHELKTPLTPLRIYLTLFK